MGEGDAGGKILLGQLNTGPARGGLAAELYLVDGKAGNAGVARCTLGEAVIDISI